MAAFVQRHYYLAVSSPRPSLTTRALLPVDSAQWLANVPAQMTLPRSLIASQWPSQGILATVWQHSGKSLSTRYCCCKLSSATNETVCGRGFIADINANRIWNTFHLRHLLLPQCRLCVADSLRVQMRPATKSSHRRVPLATEGTLFRHLNGS